MVVPAIKEIANADADALYCEIRAKVASAFCKKVYRNCIGQKSHHLQKAIREMKLMMFMLSTNCTADEFEIIKCYYKNRY
jgi:hypothetical protein